jgi:hypothetical protein
MFRSSFYYFEHLSIVKAENVRFRQPKHKFYYFKNQSKYLLKTKALDIKRMLVYFKNENIITLLVLKKAKYLIIFVYFLLFFLIKILQFFYIHIKKNKITIEI